MTVTIDHGAGIRIGRARGAQDYLELERLYRTVFRVRPGDGSINARMLTAFDRHSGIVVVGREDGRIVGFACSFLSRDRATGRLYQYSQTAAVLPEAQGRGVGRALKLAQREQALADGVELMRWAFDPLQARNAHVNLDVLGGRARTFVRDLYGSAAPGKDVGDRTDRFVLDWELTDARPAAAPDRVPDLPDLPEPPEPGEAVTVGDAVFVPVPAEWDRTRDALGLTQALALREQFATTVEQVLAGGLVAVSCRRGAADAYYVFRPEKNA